MLNITRWLPCPWIADPDLLATKTIIGGGKKFLMSQVNIQLGDDVRITVCSASLLFDPLRLTRSTCIVAFQRIVKAATSTSSAEHLASSNTKVCYATHLPNCIEENSIMTLNDE